MNIPLELLIWLSGGLCMFLTLICHLLVRLFDRIEKMDKKNDVRMFAMMLTLKNMGANLTPEIEKAMSMGGFG